VALGCDGGGNNGDEIDFAGFKKLAEKLPGFLYPSFSLYEILR